MNLNYIINLKNITKFYDKRAFKATKGTKTDRKKEKLKAYKR